MFDKIKNLLQKIENFPAKLWQLLAWFWFVILIRDFIESLSDGGGQILAFKPFFLHYPAFYFVIFFALTLIYYFLNRQDIYKIFKTLLLFSCFIWIAPLIDLIFPTWQNMSYLEVDSLKMVWQSIITLGLGGIYGQGASLGIKVEIVLALFGSAIYLFLKGGNRLKAIIGSLLTYLVIINYGLVPTYLNFLYQLVGGKYSYSDDIFTLLLTLNTGVFALIIFYLTNREKFAAWVKGINWFRTSLVWLMLAFGLGIYYYQRLSLADWQNNLPAYLIKIIAALACGFLVWQIGRLMNDLADFQFDNQSHNQNLLNYLTKSDLLNILLVYLALFCSLSLSLSYSFFVIFTIYLLIGYFYCFKPIFLKRHFVLSSLALGTNYLLAFFAGYILFFQNGDSINLLPQHLGLMIFIMVVLAISFKDIKDGQGDNLQQAKTLVTIFGQTKAAKIISILIFIAAMLPAFFINWWLLIPGFIAYLIVFYFTKKFSRLNPKSVIIATLTAYLIIGAIIVYSTQPHYIAGQLDLAKDSGLHSKANQEIWFLSSLLEDKEKNQYYFSQTYNPGIGSFLTLINLAENKTYKEYFPDDENLVITKYQFNLNHPLPGYHGSNQIKSKNNLSFEIKTLFEDGFLELDLNNSRPPLIANLSKDGEINLLNQTKMFYYALPNITAYGQILFEEKKLVPVKGSAWLDHFWGNFNIDYKNWLVFNLNLADESRITILIFDYGQTGSLVYGNLFKDGKQTYFHKIEIKPVTLWENPKTKNQWLIELELNNSDLNFKFNLKAAVSDQEIVGHNIWEGLIWFQGELNGQSVSGWGTSRQVKL